MANLTTGSAGRAIVFIDASLTDTSGLIRSLKPGTEVILLNSEQDGLTQISQTLAGRSGVESIEIFSHGGAGLLQLGGSQVTVGGLDSAADQVSQWANALTDTADILLYGCDVAAESTTFINRLSELTGADVAASNDLTGMGGDWDLEVVTGQIETQASQANYAGTLNTIIVTNTANSGAGSLRDAVSRAVSGTVIQFDPSLANQAITLSSEISIPAGRNITIDGAGVANLSISGNRTTRIFHVQSNQNLPTTFTVKGLSLVDGFTTENGGAIRGEHKASVIVQNVSFLRNVANEAGGAIYSPWENNLRVVGSRFQGNRAVAGNNERGAGAIAFASPGALTIQNSTFTSNTGINGGAVNSLNGKLTITNSRFINNNTLAGQYDSGQPNPALRGYGGALYVDRASSTSQTSGFVNIQGTRFEGNQGRGEGGAAYIFTAGQDRVDIGTTLFRSNSVQALTGGGSGNGGGLVVLGDSVSRGLNLNRTSFVGNTATNQGGGLWMWNSPTTITNSTFSGNRATGTDYNRLGGGMLLKGNTTIVNSTIANNYAGWVGGGVLVGNNYTVTARNTIFYRNTAGNGGNTWNIQQHTNRPLTNGGGNIQTGQANDDVAVQSIRVADAKLAALATNGHPFLLSHALLSGSAAINTGVSTGAPTIDQTGTTRDSRIDAGAEEFTGSTFNTIQGTASPDRLNGTNYADRISAGDGNDTLLGRNGGDILTGGTGRDYFLYSSTSVAGACKQSLLAAPDRITDFSVAAGDRLRLDYDNNLGTANLPRAMYNAQTVSGSALGAAAQAAFADRNSALGGSQALGVSEAVLFTWQQRQYIGVNDTRAGFQATTDLVVQVTGIQMPTADITASSLAVSHYFV